LTVQIVEVEVALQRLVRQAGGKWNRGLQLWELRYDQAVALGLKSRIEPSTLPDSGKARLANTRKKLLPDTR
jgi:hypothetical protein